MGKGSHPHRQSDGLETRSRVVLAHPHPHGEPCPPELTETRRCNSGYCPTYSWHVSYWTGDERAVWCQRSDGVKVEGGCSAVSRPAPVRRCRPRCTAPHAYCTDAAACGCRGDRVPLRDAAGRLVACQTFSPAAAVGAGGYGTGVAAAAENQARLHPGGSQTYWVYAVVAVLCAFILFLIVAVYTIVHSRKERSRQAARDRDLHDQDSLCAEQNGTTFMLIETNKNSMPPQTHIS